MNHLFRSIAPVFLISLLIFISSPLRAQKLDMEMFKSMKPRNIGPAGMSGRVTAIDAVHSNPNIIYVGTASGGLWKSDGGGVAWEPIFENEKAASIGAIAINQQNPDEIWVGTGEGNPRNSQSSGNGVYKSIDGGKNWVHLGLENTRVIHRIIIHKDDPNTVYIGAQGNAWADSPERGIYKTTDGGKTWNKILFVNNRTGVADMVVDPFNPNKLVVAMWEFRRWPWFFKSGGPGSGLYITYDGGTTWSRKTKEDGLPDGELGRIGLAISQSNPKVIYAIIEAEKNGLYRSDDGGFKWVKTAENKDNDDKTIGDRPFYYNDLAVDPSNENRLYIVFSNVKVSEDGGKTSKTLLGWDRVHGDHHFWWIHPQDPNLIMNGNDGGMAISRDRGKTWRFIENLPVAQFYHISVDMETPYNVMGGMQDNGSWRGPSWTWRKGGIRNSYWEEIAFGDGFDVVSDADNDRYGYGMWQGGNLLRLDYETGANRYIKPVHPDGTYLRFNWNTAIAQDPFDKSIIYYGSQFVHKTSDQGQTWEIISPDLTTNDPNKQKQVESGGLTYDVTNAENYTTIIAISPSPLQQGVIWVGTDDGNIQLTQDGGKTWTNLVSKIKGFPKGAWITQIHSSKYNAGEAYVVVNNYRMGDWTPYLYRTRDFGKTWQRLVEQNDVWGYTLSFVQDPVEPKLMFLGTEFGLYVSIDEGTNWNKWEDYPTVSTIDMQIHPRDYDLVIGTFGRSAFVLDDIRPLRELAQKGTAILNEPLHLFPIPDAILALYAQATGTRFAADAIYKGENRAYGALVTFALQDVTNKDNKGNPLDYDSLKVEISNEAGQVIRTLKVRAEPGLNRFNWWLDSKGVRQPNKPRPKPDAKETGGPLVLPGSYTVSIHYGQDKVSGQVNVLPDPRLEISLEDIQKIDQLRQRLLNSMMQATEAVDKLRDAQDAMAMVMKRVDQKNLSNRDEFIKRKEQLDASIDRLWGLITTTKNTQGIYRDPQQVGTYISSLGQYFNGPFNPPSSDFGTPKPLFFGSSPSHALVVEKAEKALEETIKQYDQFFEKDWEEFKAFASDNKIALFD